jgi:hypothetical protein
MKLSFRDQNRQSTQGSILLVTMGLAVLSGVTLASYYTLVVQEHRTVSRSQSWNRSLTLAEAGVDEALAQVNASPGNFTANNWGGTGGTNGSFGPVTRTLSDGTYSVAIVNSSVPAIYATGFVAVADTSQTVSRKVKVTFSPQQMSPFTVALGAVTNINMNGHQVITDSYNSQTNTLSTNGQYDPNKTSTNGSIASVGGIVNIGQQTINGNLYLGPTASYDSSVSQILGAIFYDYNVQFPPATLPTIDNNGVPIVWLNAPGTSSAHNFATSGYFWVNDSGTITVQPGVTVTLQVTVQDFSPASITLNGGITNSGSIIMYHNPPDPGGTVTLRGNSSGGATGNRPVDFIFFGLDNLSYITLGGTTDFTGAVYAPKAVLNLNGGGHSVNVEGSLIVGQATDNGHYYIHYDESLGNWVGGPNRGYIATSWQEL